MTAASPRWTSSCPDCGRADVEVETRLDHGARVLCDGCAGQPHRPSLPPDLGLVTTNGAGPSTSLRQRLGDARVDLLALLDHGIPEREWLPRSENMLARGKRHHVSAPMKSGKSLGFLAHAVDMTIAGARVVILDRENGADEYARRLRDILSDRPASAQTAIRERLTYYAWPAIKLTDGGELAAALDGPDILILDSTRTFLSGFDLDEDSSDDFAKFAAAIIDPLFRAGIATVQLDNAGHGDTGRARGTSSKGDLADVTYSLKTTTPFDRHRRGTLRLVRTHSRLGDIDRAFAMELGGGHFGAFTPEGDTSPDDTTGDTRQWRPTHLMEKISCALEAAGPGGLSSRALLAAIGSGKNRESEDARRLAVELLTNEGNITVEAGARNAHIHRSLRPYRETNDDRPPTAPAPPPGTLTPTVLTAPPPYGGQGTEDRQTEQTTAPKSSGGSR